MLRLRLFIALLLLPAPAAFSYIRLVYSDGAGPFASQRPDHAAIQFYVNNQIAPGQVSNAGGAGVTVVSPNSDPVGAVRAALATWHTGTGANIRFLPLKTTSAAHNPGDYQSTIAFASAEDLSALGYSPGKSAGALALTVSTVASQSASLPNGMSFGRGDIEESDILLNSSLTFSTDGSTGFDLQAVLTHEIGHALGMNHTGLLGATMFPYASVGGVPVLTQRLLSSDEISFAKAVYPFAGSSGLGTIAGKVVASDGSAVKAAFLTMVDPAGGNSIGAITSADGTYAVQAPPASYIIHVEPMTLGGIVDPRNIIALDTSQVTSNFLPSVLGGLASPTSVTVTAGNTVTAPDLTVNGGLNSLSAPMVAFGKAGGAGDVQNVKGIDGPQTVASGQSLDIAFLSGGMDGMETIRIFGAGITITGAPHVDKSVNFSLGPLVRTTITIPARQTPALASILIFRPGGAISLSGGLVVVPPKPTFVSKGIVSAASYVGLNNDGVVSPGGLYSIYDIPDNPNLGPAAFAVPDGYDAYGKVPAALAGVTVTFDGIEAPMFLSFNSQLNVQAPFELAGRTSTVVQVNYLGSLSDPVRVPVVAEQPAFFTITPLGTDSIAGNQDYTLNTAQNPAARGGVVTIYGTGIGQSSYAVSTGQGAPGPPAGYTGGNTCVLGGTRTVNVAFTGWTPTAVGLAQWSLVIPPDSPTGKVSVRCTAASGGTTQQGTLYIK
jgi:uncharacterized protein (TIGR03437 family)